MIVNMTYIHHSSLGRDEEPCMFTKKPTTSYSPPVGCRKTCLPPGQVQASWNRQMLMILPSPVSDRSGQSRNLRPCPILGWIQNLFLPIHSVPNGPQGYAQTHRLIDYTGGRKQGSGVILTQKATRSKVRTRTSLIGLKMRGLGFAHRAVAQTHAEDPDRKSHRKSHGKAGKYQLRKLHRGEKNKITLLRVIPTMTFQNSTSPSAPSLTVLSEANAFIRRPVPN